MVPEITTPLTETTGSKAITTVSKATTLLVSTMPAEAPSDRDRDRDPATWVSLVDITEQQGSR